MKARSRRELFARAAEGMFTLVTDLEGVRCREKVRVSVQAPDRVALLQAWLGELNFRHVTRHLLFCRFDIRRLEDTRLEAVAGGERIDPGRHAVYTEIKAVTFHGLTIERKGRGWEAQIIFDL